MKKNRFYWRPITIVTWATMSWLFLVSCNDGGEEAIPVKKDVLIVNAGNFGGGNGSISLYDEEEMKIENNALKSANNGSELGSAIESIASIDNTGYIICNSNDKIEFIDLNTLKYSANPLSDISTPRYMTAIASTGYITCWGPYSANYTLDDSYVAVMDLNTRTLSDSVSCGSGPEGIIAIGNNLYIANSYDTTITIFNVMEKSTSTLRLGAAPQHFVVDGSGMLWVSLGSYYGTHSHDNVGLQSINPNTNTLDTFMNFSNIGDEGHMAVDGIGKKIYFLTAEAWPGTNTNVFVLDTQDKSIDNTPLITGENFASIGYNTTTDKLYISDAAGFQGPGRVLIYDISGTKLDEKTTSIGPFHFVYK